jgi:homogentisate phytyltransferase/homogentisate geranylgeranyltransferase
MAITNRKARPAAIKAASPGQKLRALGRFTRQHTVIGTACQTIGVFIIAHGEVPLTTATLLVLALTFAGCQAANLFVVGLNQLTDVPIDRLNKPELPLASGELSRREGVGLVAAAGVMALLIGASQSIWLFLTLALVMLIGAAYSLPPRFKSQPLAAAVSIALARGVIANLGLFLHYHSVLGGPDSGPDGQFAWALLFFFGFGLVIALYKDIPDRDGDAHFAVRTLAVRWGRRRVFTLGRWLLAGAYLLGVGVGLARWPGPDGIFLILTHLAALAVFWAASARIDPTRPPAMARLYRVLWGLFYAEYAILSLTVLLLG